MANSLMLSVMDNASYATGATSYKPLANSDPTQAANPTEANVQHVWRLAGTFDHLYVNVGANSTTAASTVKFRKNAAAGNLSISVSAGATGVFSDLVNSDAVITGDKVAIEIVPGSANTWLSNRYSARFAATSNTAIKLANAILAGVSATNNRFHCLAGTLTNITTESDGQTEINTAGTLKNFQVNVSANSRTTTSTFKIRKNTADGNEVISVLTLTTGFFEDLVNTDTIAANDLANYGTATGGGGGTLTVRTFSVDFETTDSTWTFAQGNSGSYAAASTDYQGASGSVGATATESKNEALVDVAGTLANLWLKVTVNTLSVAMTSVARKDNADTALTVSVSAAATGLFEDTTNSVTYTAANKIGRAITVPAGSGSATVTTRSMKYTNTGGAAATVILDPIARGLIPFLR